VDDKVVGAIEKGLCLLVGLHRTDTTEELKTMVNRVLKLRLFGEEKGMWTKSVRDCPEPGILAVSQFTLYARCDKGSKPDFHEAMRGEDALPMFNSFVDMLRAELKSDERVQTGAFGQMMSVNIVNDGPVTLVLESKQRDSTESPSSLNLNST
jgi:D-tyrosyl-tRNA(Tyr) deacylase